MESLRLLLSLILGLLSLAVLPVDSCTWMQHEAACKACVNSFVDGFKSNANCSVGYTALKKCIVTEMNKCLKSPEITNTTARHIHGVSSMYTANEQFFCQDGMLDTHSKASLPTCTAKFFRRIAKCRARFQKQYLKNRGSRRLCRKFYKAKQCMRKALRKHCKPTDLTRFLVQNKYKQPYNAYCKDRKDPIKKAARSPGFGTCTQKGYVIKSRECIKNFVQTLQRNQGNKCRASVVSELVPCIKIRTKRCLQGTQDAETLDRAVDNSLAAQTNHMQNMYCEGSFLETLPLAQGQCTQEYFEDFQGECNSKFVAKYRKNRASPLLCEEYAKVKRCARNMTLSLCTLNKSMKDAVNFVYGDFNPFCRDGKDPRPAKHPEGKHEKHKGSTTNKANTHAWSWSTLVIGILIVASLGWSSS